jgi:cytoplasmic FMR1 interacting protein
MFAVVKLLGSRSLPWLVRALLDFLSQKISVMEPRIQEMRDSMPKAIAIPSHDWGGEGCLRNFSEQLQWAGSYDGLLDMLQGLKEIGSLIFWMSLLDTVMV